MKKYGRHAAHDQKVTARDHLIYRDKLIYELLSFLERAKLARPARNEDGFLEVHPKIGRAVMTTLAFACAESEGLQVVTEFSDLHGRIIGKPEGSIYRACIDDIPSEVEDLGEDALQFIIYRRCNVDMLTAERLAALNQEWEALAAFRGALEKAASRVPKNIQNEVVRVGYLNDVANDIHKKWKEDSANFYQLRS